MKFKSFILPLLIILSSQLNAQKIQDQNFQSSYDEISAMLEGKQPLDFERAVFLTENAYRGNAIEYKDFKAVLDLSTEMIQQLIKVNDKQDWRQYVRGTKVTPQRELQAKESYQRSLANWAIYTWMTDTVEVRLNDQSFSRLPLSYSNDDPFGTIDWKNSQVLNLFESGKGNCYSLVTLFKIFSERFKSEASIVTAPQHIYIEHRDPNGNTFNVELATRSFPNMGSIQTLTYTTREGLLNDISMRSLDLKQSVGLCLIYLAKGYQYKNKTSDDEFLLTCANTALQFDARNLNALLLKAQVYEQRVIKGRMEAAPYESLLADLYTLGYRQMPDDMRDIILSKIQGRQSAPIVADKNPNPYHKIGEQARYVTLSNGLFDEVHQSQKIVRYGRTIFDTEKSKIVKFLDEDVSSYQVDPVVFALSVDPLTRSYPELTPYQFASNTPIQSIDLDGLEQMYYLLNLAVDEPKLKLYKTRDQWYNFGFLDSKSVEVQPLGTTYTFTPWANTDRGDVPGAGTGNYIGDFDKFASDPIAAIYSGGYRTDQEVMSGMTRDIVLSLLIGRAYRIIGGKTTRGLDGAKFAQNKVNKQGVFSTDGQLKYSKLAGKPIKTIDDLAGSIKAGDVNVNDITVDYVMRNGEKVILNTRTSAALNKAGVPMSKWNGVDRTNVEVPGMKGTTFNDLAEQQIKNNYKPGETLTTKPDF